MFEDISRIIEEGHLGVLTYQGFADKCLALCRADDERAVYLFVLAKIVEAFSEYYRDQPLDEGHATAFRSRLRMHIDALNAASDEAHRVAALSHIIRHELRALLP